MRLPASIITALSALVAAAAFSQESGRAAAVDFSAFKIISERNIFDPNRRPHFTPGPEVKIVDSFALAGTMFYGTQQLAVFDGSSPDYRKVTEAGGGIAGYKVSEIGLNSVMLSEGTNRLEMKIGMQLRRNEDGQWSLADDRESGGSSGGYASSRRRGRSQSFRRGSNTGEPAMASLRSDESQPADTAADAASETDTNNLPPEIVNGDPNDPVVRMMQRRAQELNGNENRTPNQ